MTGLNATNPAPLCLEIVFGLLLRAGTAVYSANSIVSRPLCAIKHGRSSKRYGWRHAGSPGAAALVAFTHSTLHTLYLLVDQYPTQAKIEYEYI